MREDGETVMSRVVLTATKIFVFLKKMGKMKNFSLAVAPVKYLNLRMTKKSADIGKMQEQYRVAELF